MFRFKKEKKAVAKAKEAPPSPSNNTPNPARTMQILKEFRAEAEARGEDINEVAQRFLDDYRGGHPDSGPKAQDLRGHPPLAIGEAPGTPGASPNIPLEALPTILNGLTNTFQAMDNLRENLADSLIAREEEDGGEEELAPVMEILKEAIAKRNANASPEAPKSNFNREVG